MTSFPGFQTSQSRRFLLWEPSTPSLSNEPVSRFVLRDRTEPTSVTGRCLPPFHGTALSTSRCHERPVPPGGPGRAPGPPAGGHAEGAERPGRGRDDADPVGRLPRQPGGAPADREQRVSAGIEPPTFIYCCLLVPRLLF